MKKKIAVVLSGCGVYDGAEIHEATLTLLAIHQQGADYQCFAPDVKQAHVINHLTGEEMPESRNVLLESARIARGNILAFHHLTLRSTMPLFSPADSEWPKTSVIMPSGCRVQGQSGG